MVLSVCDESLTLSAATAGSPQSQCTDLSTYCGGTFSGLASKVDFIQDLGFSSVWISPIPVRVSSKWLDSPAY